MKVRIMITTIGAGIIAIGAILAVKKYIIKSENISDTDLDGNSCMVDDFNVDCFGPIETYDGSLIPKDNSPQGCTEM